MPDLTYTCDCGTYMSASDVETLDWGISTHVCARESLPDLLETSVLVWIAGLYKRPFVLRRADGSGAVVS